ncbi:MAG TPA: hypothetical protein VKB31_06280 [Trueperaceae bacterium]|nr:hypothetical protein [Trueperaceae bacterium]
MTAASTNADTHPPTTADRLRALEPETLYLRSDLSGLDFETTDDLEPMSGPLGQERAQEALELGLSIG